MTRLFSLLSILADDVGIVRTATDCFDSKILQQKLAKFGYKFVALALPSLSMYNRILYAVCLQELPANIENI